MHILIAPNAFKNSLSAHDVAAALREGFLQSMLDCTCECFPIGDGGDGTAELIIEKRAGRKVNTEVKDPLGRTIISSFGLIDNGKTAVIEMANASGLRLLKPDELNPLRALSFGTGQQIKSALDQGAGTIVIGMGGSATVDGACGMLLALGARFLNASGEELTGLPESLSQLETVDTTGIDQRIFQTEVMVLCDVDNLLLGPAGSAAIFGPQKGASQQGVQVLDGALAKFAEVACKQTGRDMTSIKYGGTAGGAAAGLYALINARLVNGIDHFLKLTGFGDSLNSASIVVTGEGSIDEQTLQGKGPFGVAYQAKQRGLPVFAIAGKVPLEKNMQLQQYFDVLLAIGNEPVPLQEALKTTTQNISRVAWEMGNMLSLQAR